MGGNSSKEEGRTHMASYGSSSSFSRWDSHGYLQSPRPPRNQYYTPQHSAPAPFYEYGSQTSKPNNRRLDRRFSRIADDYRSLDEVRLLVVSLILLGSNYQLLDLTLATLPVTERTG
ncbi:hypothetical protein QN277_014377 [Acacia crassicarpa]|uniref:Uncharacterized protein n=1 Tax=Acacia crassicarpa TaxID=499986 RepID=A0AAE1IM28_9FABA|nr:hypothetical protein QN277_014377 [Acacia crassicarpa]